MNYPDTVVVIDANGLVRVFGSTQNEVAIVDLREGRAVINHGEMAPLEAIPAEIIKKLDNMRDGTDDWDHKRR